MAENCKPIIEEFIFNGSPGQFKRLYQGDELYNFFQERSEQHGVSNNNWDPFNTTSPSLGGLGKGYEWRMIRISDNQSKLVVRVFGSKNSWSDFRSNLEQQGLIIPIDQVDESAFHLMPKKESTIDLYKKAWKIWLVMIYEYDEDVLDGRSKKSKPTMEDYRARVTSELNWQVSTRTLSSVKRLGKLGLLD